LSFIPPTTERLPAASVLDPVNLKRRARPREA
jgi:hypothetical protein